MIWVSSISVSPEMHFAKVGSRRPKTDGHLNEQDNFGIHEKEVGGLRDAIKSRNWKLSPESNYNLHHHHHFSSVVVASRAFKYSKKGDACYNALKVL